MSELSRYEVQILRECAGLEPASPWGAAVGQALEVLKENGYLSGRLPTLKGWHYLMEEVQRDKRGRQGLTTEASNSQKRIKKAQRMVVALCKQERRWIMSIPADRERDPDLVIGDGLRAGLEAVNSLSECATHLRALMHADEQSIGWETLNARELEVRESARDWLRKYDEEEAGRDTEQRVEDDPQKEGAKNA